MALLTDLQYIEAKCCASLLDDLLAEYLSAYALLATYRDALAEREAALRSRLDVYRSFRGRNAHFFRGAPELVLPIARATDRASIPAKEADALLAKDPASPFPVFGLDAKGKRGKWIECLQTRGISVAKDPLLYTILGHEGPINCVAVSPNDSHILTGGDDRLAKLWDVKNGTFHRAFSGHSAAVQSCALFKRGGLHFAVTVRIGCSLVWLIVSLTFISAFTGAK